MAPTGGFADTVCLTASGFPSGAGGSFSPAAVTNRSPTATFSVTTASTTPAGTYTLTFQGSDGSLVHSDP